MGREISLKEYGRAVSKFVKSTLKSNILLHDNVPSVSTSNRVIFEGKTYLSETKVTKIEDDKTQPTREDKR